MTHKYSHVSIGNLNLDVVLYIDRYPVPGENIIALDLDIRPGGSATNYAVAIAQYGHRAYLVASVSLNPLMDSPLDFIKSRGVELSMIKRVEEEPGIVVILVDKEGERTIFSYPGANACLQPQDIPYEKIREMHVLHMASITGDRALEIAKRARRYDLLITYDPGGRATTIPDNIELLEYLDVLLINKKELKKIMPSDNLNSLFKHGLHTLVVKLGEKGAIAYSSSGICIHGYTTPIKKPVDSTGAGDAFDAFFNAKFIESKDIAQALRYGVAAGALKIGYRGSMLLLEPSLFNQQLDKTIVEKRLDCVDLLS